MIYSVNRSQAAGLAALSGKSTSIQQRVAVEAGKGEDSVEISSTGARLSKLASMSGVRHELVDRVRQEIAAGRYESPERVDAAINKLAQQLI